MLILPVLDVQQGVAVHGRAGLRSEYQPVQTVLTPQCTPWAVAKAYQTVLGLTQLYLADLDAIEAGRPDAALYAQLQRLGMRLWLDAGIGNVSEAKHLEAVWPGTHWEPIVGLETLKSEADLNGLLAWYGAERLVLSLDLDEGRPRTRCEAWAGMEPLRLARCLVRAGVRRFIVLDLKRVGMGQGTGTGDLLRQLRSFDTPLQLIAGGGVASMDDAWSLTQAGCDGLLLASTLHDGRIGRTELRRLGG